MSGLKKHLHALSIAKSEYAVVPDEIDRYEVFSIEPAISATFLASAGTAGTASAIAMVITNRTPDWPRNINFALAGTGVGMAGTLDVNGRDQFGASQSESLGFGSADNGGTVVGSRVFAEITSGTLRYGTAVGNGTPAIGFVPGTGCLLGLPVKIAGTTDVVWLGMNAGTGPITYNGGTVAGFVNSTVHAVRPAAAINGTSVISVWVKPSYSFNNQRGIMSNGTQAV